MSGVYARNKLFDIYCRAGAEELPELENDVCVDDVTKMTAVESYETSLEDGWPDFIEDFCV
ncbi:MAG: hypothetical protein LBJ22_07000 [Synergistaceae bacterium]|nr:hypothetical protein [Synergistaceae bacterium]